jgi:hypothetical protein
MGKRRYRVNGKNVYVDMGLLAQAGENVKSR